MRIASLLPSATEIAYALGAGDEVVAVSHECDYPEAARGRPVLTGSAVDTKRLSSPEIDAAISALLREGGSTYSIDLPLLRQLNPDLILTQALCDVCAVSEGQVHRALHEEQLGARVITLTPLTLAGVFQSIEEVAGAIGRVAEGRALTATLRARVEAVRRAAPTPRPRVLALEWFDPHFIGGHWVPEQIEAAGGIDVLGRGGERSFRVTWDQIAAADPDLVVLLPCGYGQAEVIREARALWEVPAWRSLRAVERGALWAVDASAWFSRPGPRVVEGIEALAHILADPLATDGPAGTRRLAAPSA